MLSFQMTSQSVEKKAQRNALGKFSFIPKREEGSVKNRILHAKQWHANLHFF